jgi:PPOX class probable F420-dependent enzyme
MSIPERAFLGAARRALLATMAPDGRARLVPICFVLDSVQPVLYTPIDEKPKTVEDPRSLARVRDLLADPRVSILVDRWDEDWAQLAWLRCLGSASLLEPGADGGARPEHGLAAIALRAKYPQYVAQRLETRPIIRIVIERATSWGRLELD